MKSLLEYINEASKCKCGKDCKKFTFNFDGIDNGEETLKSLADIDCCEVDGTSVTVCVCPDDPHKVDTAQDILQQAIQIERNGTKSTNNESYAQKVVKLEKSLSDMLDAIDEFDAPEEPEEGDKKEDK